MRAKVSDTQSVTQKTSVDVEALRNALIQMSSEEFDQFMKMVHEVEFERAEQEYVEDMSQVLIDAGIVDTESQPYVQQSVSNVLSAQAADKDKFEADIFVDGSNDSKTGRYAYGIKIVDKTGTHYFNRAYPKDEMSSMNNVAGEIAGAKTAIQYCIDNGIRSAHIQYDYKGIEEWATGGWQAKNQHTQAYRDFCQDAREFVNIKFTHVKGHTGVDGNEVCDALAKEALGIPVSKKHRDMYQEALSTAKPYVSSSMKHVNAMVAQWSDDEPMVSADKSYGV